MIKDVTNQIIEDYLDFSGKDKSCISANEYLMFRDRAEEEIKNGLFQKEGNNKEQNTLSFPKTDIKIPSHANTPAPVNETPVLQMPIKTNIQEPDFSGLLNLAQKISG